MLAPTSACQSTKSAADTYQLLITIALTAAAAAIQALQLQSPNTCLPSAILNGSRLPRHPDVAASGEAQPNARPSRCSVPLCHAAPLPETLLNARPDRPLTRLLAGGGCTAAATHHDGSTPEDVGNRRPCSQAAKGQNFCRRSGKMPASAKP